MGSFFTELIGAIVQVAIFSLIPFVWWFITARRSENFLKWLGFKKINHKDGVIVTILVSIVVLLVYGFAVSYVSKFFSGELTFAGDQYTGKGMSYIPVALIYGFIRTGLSEEVIFRGFLLKRFANKFGFVTGNIMQSVLFGLMHGIPFGLASGSIAALVTFTLLPGIIGFYMGWVNEKRCDGSIIPSWLMHGITNSVDTFMLL